MKGFRWRSAAQTITNLSSLARLQSLRQPAAPKYASFYINADREYFKVRIRAFARNSIRCRHRPWRRRRHAGRAAFQRRRPGHELEAEPVVDHGEAAGGERQALAIGAGDMLAGRRLVCSGSPVSAESFAPDRIEFALAAACRAGRAEG